MKAKLIPITILLAGIVLTRELQAQFTLDWSTVGAGGGFLSGGVYSLNGTVGQLVAGNLAGGSYELSSGFWSIVESPRPLLRITRSDQKIIVSWPLSAAGYNLEQNPSTLPNSWATISPPYGTNTTSYYLRITSPARQMFFRLHKP